MRDAIQSIVTNLGAQIRTSTPVEQIVLEQPSAAAAAEGARPRAVGVRLASGEVMTADVIVANPDLPQVFHHMLEGALPPAPASAPRLGAPPPGWRTFLPTGGFLT